jgi:putative transposase
MLLRQVGGTRRVNVKRVHRLWVPAGLKLPPRKRRKRRGQGVKTPVVAEYPNHVWAYDFVFGWCENGHQLKFLTVVDEFTREGLAIAVDHHLGARQVCAVLERLMRQRGVPTFVRSDNGPEFIARALTRMLSVKGVACRHIDPGSPWQNGKNERFNDIFRDECANRETFHHRDHARAICRLFLKYYNQERPHSSLGYQTPLEFARRHPPWGAPQCRGEGFCPSRKFLFVMIDVYVFEVYTSGGVRNGGLTATRTRRVACPPPLPRHRLSPDITRNGYESKGALCADPARINTPPAASARMPLLGGGFR